MSGQPSSSSQIMDPRRRDALRAYREVLNTLSMNWGNSRPITENAST